MTKVECLSRVIKDLKNNKLDYCWISTDTCNCGVVATTLLEGKRPTDCGFFNSPSKSDGGPFSREAFCLTTNLPLPLVFQRLKDTGFSYEDLCQLEYLNNPDVVREMTDNNYSLRRSVIGNKFFLSAKGDIAFDKKGALVLYLEAWVRILEREVPAPQTLLKERIRYVSVPETIKKMELVLS